MTFIRVWRYRPRRELEPEFVEMYGAAGGWAQLFQRGDGYLGTDLSKVEDGSGEYQTVDRWRSRADWDAFLRENAVAYRDLDGVCERLTETEWQVEERDRARSS